LGALVFKNKKKSHSEPLLISSILKNKIILESKNPKLQILLEITLYEDDLIHFRYNIFNNVKLSFTTLTANYAIFLGNNPDYTWVPHIRPKENFVIGDHVFRSPVIIYNQGKYSFAFIPDLEMLRFNRPVQAFMDLNLKPKQNIGFPQLLYGFGNYKPMPHVFFKHNPKKKFEIKPKSDLSFGYYIKVFNGASITEILLHINSFLWEKYGSRLLYANCNPQVLPFDTYVQEGFNAMIKRHNFWGSFKIDNKECGGIFFHTYLGNNKKPIKYIKPEEYPKFFKQRSAFEEVLDSFIAKVFIKLSNNRRAIKFFDWLLPRSRLSNRYAEIRNNAWFMNIRTGYSLRYFAKLWKDESLKTKGRKFLNTVLNLPRIRGAFPAVVLPNSPNTDYISTVNGLKAHIYSNDFGIVDICLAMFWAIKYFEDFGDDDNLDEKCKDLVNLLKEIQLKNGAIPTYFNFEKDKKTPIISEDLINSASSGAPLMFLTEYYKISKDKKIIPIAEKIAKYIQTEIIPQDKWHDFEPFYSCTHFPRDIYDEYTKSHVMNNLCIYWCADGLKELYKITKKDDYLQMGERVLAILSLFQQVWDLPYIDYNTYGGFGVQNADAELSDARQALFVRTYMEYYLITGKKEYMERGIAALRASFALMLLREQEEQCPGNLLDVDTIDGIDRGSMYENYGHVGYNMHCSPFVLTDWGIGSSASAAAYVKKHFGDLFIDFQEEIAWGIDGLIVKTSKFLDNAVRLTIWKIPTKKYIILKARAPPENDIEITINEQSIGMKNQKELEHGFIF